MSEDGEDTGSGREKKGFLWEELKSLIDALQDLQKQVSSRLLEARLQSSKPSSAAGDGAEINALLKDHIDSSVRDTTTPGVVPESPQAMSAEPGGKEEESIEVRVETGPVRDALLHPNELSEHLKSQGAGREFERHMGEKLQANTLDHINRALRLAKQGNREGAYVHAELAENAMKLAGEYLSETEYDAFRRDVEARLEAAAGRR